MSKRPAEEDEKELKRSKKQKLQDEEESASDEEVSGEEDSEDDIEGELADLVQDQQEAGVGHTTGRRTRGVKIDFSGKKLPGEPDGDIGDEEEDDDDDEEEEGEGEAGGNEVVMEDGGKGKGKAVIRPTATGVKPASKVGGTSKPTSKIGGAGSSKA